MILANLAILHPPNPSSTIIVIALSNTHSPIVVDNLGRCVIAEEEGEGDVKTSRPKSGNALVSVNFLPQWK